MTEEEMQKYIQIFKDKDQTINLRQKNEITAGSDHGLDESAIKVYAIPDFSAHQMQIIRTSFEEYIEREYIINKIAIPSLSVEKMIDAKRNYFAERKDPSKEIELLMKNIDISILQFKTQLEDTKKMYEFIVREMEEKVSNHKKEIEEKELIHKKELEQLREQLDVERQLNDVRIKEVEQYKLKYNEQMEKCTKIQKEIKNNHTIDKEDVIKANVLQKSGILNFVTSHISKKGLEEVQKRKKHEVLLSLICDKNFEESQLVEIQAGYNDGLSMEDIKKYARPEIHADKMKSIRKIMCNVKGISTLEDVKPIEIQKPCQVLTEQSETEEIEQNNTDLENQSDALEIQPEENWPDSYEEPEEFFTDDEQFYLSE